MKVCWSLFTRFMFVSGFSFCDADMVVVDSEQDGQYVSLSTLKYIDLLLLGTTVLLCSVGAEKENIWKGERLQAHLDVSSSANPCDSGAHHHTDPKSDEEQDENTTPPSQKPPRPGIKSVRKKRKRTERARRKEQREKLEEKNRKKAVDISLYQFIKEEVFHIRKNRQMKKRRPKKVERGPVFKPVRRPTPPPPKNAFCMRPKNKKKSHLLKYETSRSTKAHSGRSVRPLRDALLVLAHEEGITDEECADLYERETMLLNRHPSDEHSKNVQSLRKRLVHGLKKLTESNLSSKAIFQRDSSNAAKQVDTEKAIKPSNEIANTTKKIPPNNNAKCITNNRELCVRTFV
uniref:ENT domain-containing protein n=1 Tax=Ascaris lumbricoides TaxID=6252 RepID=A0A0M3I5Q6_ASCLU